MSVPGATAAPRWPLARRLSWGILGLLLVLGLVGALRADRDAWPSFIGDEATYLMQAESLAWDGDLAYQAGDYHRFVTRWEVEPVGVILQSGDDGRRITFGKPVFYALWAAPFLRLFPVHGAFVANALLLALASVLAARALEPRVGPSAALWVASLVFATPVFAYVGWVHPDLFSMCLTALALGAVLDPRPPAAPWRGVARWAVAGALLAVVVYSRPLYAPLFLPLLLAIRWRRSPGERRRDLLPLLAAALLVVSATAALHLALTGSLTGYGAVRRGFYEHTGYPAVDFPTTEWKTRLDALGNSAVRSPAVMLEYKRLPPSLFAWNTTYFLVGRHVGVVPYFLPVLLAFLPWGRRGARAHGTWGAVEWALLLAVALSILGFFYTRPFNFYGGGGSLANRYFLPLYPALWFLAGRLRASWVLLATAVAGLFVAGLWREAASFPIGDDGRYRYLTPAAERLLPFETTQSHLKLAGREDQYEGFYLRFLGPDVAVTRPGHLQLPAGGTAELLLGTARPFEHVVLQVDPPTAVAVEGARAEPLPGRPGRYRLILDPPIARHALWWTWEGVDLYRLALRFPAAERPTRFRLLPPEG